jgi:hypothetical protein
MTLLEFVNEFRFKYDAASNGGPDIDPYEMSLMLTQAVKDITDLAVSTYEANDESRRLVAGILKYHNSTISQDSTDSKQTLKYKVSLPEKLVAVLREVPSLDNCTGTPEVVVARMDEVSSLLNNPFKKPNKRKVLKLEKDKGFVSIYSTEVLKSYTITYIPEIIPIIVEDLEDDLSIEGLSSQSETNLPAFIHSKIVDVAVTKAIMATRSNSIQKS